MTDYAAPRRPSLPMLPSWPLRRRQLLFPQSNSERLPLLAPSAFASTPRPRRLLHHAYFALNGMGGMTEPASLASDKAIERGGRDRRTLSADGTRWVKADEHGCLLVLVAHCGAMLAFGCGNKIPPPRLEEYSVRHTATSVFVGN